MRITSPLQRGIVLAVMLLFGLPPVVGLFIPLDPINDPITGKRFTEKESNAVLISIWAVSAGAGFLYYCRSDRLAKSSCKRRGADTTDQGVKRIRHAMALATAFGLLSSCTSAPPRIVVLAPYAADVKSIGPLDIRFAEVRFHRMPILDAIDLLSAEVHRVYGDAYFFSPAYQRPAQPLEVMARALPNPRVSFNSTNVSAREVFSSICQEVGWSYEWNAKHDIMFTIP